MARVRRRGWTVASAVAVLAASTVMMAGCGEGHYVRDTEVPEIDEYTMSLRLDKKDIDRLYDENIDRLLSSSVTAYWERQARQGMARESVAIFPMRNETSEPIDAQLDTLLSKFETDLVNRADADVVSLERQPELIAEIKRTWQSGAYDPQRLAPYGRQVGARYLVTGKVYDTRQSHQGATRVQYAMFVQVIEVETGIVRFQHDANLTKARLP